MHIQRLGAVEDVCFDPEGNKIAAIDQAGVIVISDVNTNDLILSLHLADPKQGF